MYNLAIIFVFLLTQTICDLILLSQGEHYTELFDVSNYEVVSDCQEAQLQIQEHSLAQQDQLLEKQSIEQILYYPSNQNIILILERTGKVTVLFKDNNIINSPFKELGTIDLNDQELQNFECDDMTQYNYEIFLVVCRSSYTIYIARVICDSETDRYLSGCQSKLFLDTETIDNCDQLNIITESTWRIKDPEYLTIYCSAQEDFSVSRPIFVAKIMSSSNSLQMGKLFGPIYEIEKVSFFDDNTLMILDHRSGLYVYRFTFTDTGEISYEQLLWQLFLPNELFYALSYSHEQNGIRFPPYGIMENDIQYSIVILSDKFIYELALPARSNDFFFTTLPINDKINMEMKFKNQKIKKGQIQYDEQYYYVCITTEKQVGYDTECLRINRHSDYTFKNLLQNNLQHPILLTYPVAFSAITGQTNILVVQQQDQERIRLSLIRNDIDRLSVLSLSNEEFVCASVYKRNQSNITLMFYNQKFESTDLFKIDHLQDYHFPNTESTVPFSTLIRGPAPLLTSQSDNESIKSIYIRVDVLVGSFTGLQFEMEKDIFDNFISVSRIPIKTFLDKGFRIGFVQIDTVKMIVQEEMVNSQNFTTEIYEAKCSASSLVRQIVGISPYYFVFYQKISYYTVLKIIKSDDGEKEFEIICTNVDFPFNIEWNYEVFVDLDFINFFISTDTAIYASDLYAKNILKIETDRRFRDLNFKFLKNNIILGSYMNKLYQIELINPYKSMEFKTKITEIELGTLGYSFKFFVISIKNPIQTLVIVDERITLYTIDNLNDIKFDSILPQFNNVIDPNNTRINYHMLIVPISKQNELFIYDLTKTGSDRLFTVHRWSVTSEPLTISYPKGQDFEYCMQFNNATINCYFEKLLDFELTASDPTNIENSFKVQITAQSSLSHSVQKTFTIQGSFRYQDTMIAKFTKQIPPIEIYKSNYSTELNITDYYSGPIFGYEIQPASDSFNLLPFILENVDNVVLFKFDQTILGTSVSKEYLIILGDEDISIINIPSTQYQKQVVRSAIDYEEIKNVFFDADQPPVNNCSKSFINTLSIAELSGIHIIALFCESMMVRIDVTNKINQLSFTILSENEPIEKQFLDNFFFLNINYKDFLYQNQSSFILEDLKMINFPLQFKPKYKFLSVSALVKANKRYEQSDTQRDHVICIFFGYLDQSVSSLMKGTLLDVVGALNFGRNTLIVNNFQMYCVRGCQIITQKEQVSIDTYVELVFNDQYMFNLYRLQIHVTWQDGKTPTYEMLQIKQLNIKDLMNNFVQNLIDFTYIDTLVTYQNEETLTINVTTDSLSFDLVQYDSRIEIEQIFKQYTQCQSPPGSFKASYHEYFAISCKNSSMRFSEQTQYVKLFLRGESQTKPYIQSVIQASRINGNLILLDIQKGYLNEHVRMLVLEQDFNNQEFQLRWFALNDKFILQVNESSTPRTMFNLQLCPYNLNEAQGLCTDIPISNTGYKQYIVTELLLFSFLIMLPLLLSCFFIIWCVINYKSEKQKRIESFGQNLEHQLKSQPHLQSSRTDETIY